jgi:hypothetical protein
MNKNQNRDIPRKPIEKTSIYCKYGFVRTQTTHHYCPLCGFVLNSGPNYQQKYCSECGQRITFEGITFKPDIELGYVDRENHDVDNQKGEQNE